MQWEELTGDEFPAAVKQAGGVCLLPLACLERHAHHLPIGTDYFRARELCRRAAELEPVMVFPAFIFTQIMEARHLPGTIALDGELILHLLDQLCAEIARNGLNKIILVSAHGGNSHFTRYFAQAQLASPRDYVVYVSDPSLREEDEAAIQALWETRVDGHAGESETSDILAIRPDLVHLQDIPGDPEGMPLERLKMLEQAGVYTGIWWYADHPTHYCGDGRPGTAEKGQRQLAAQAQALAAVVRMVKADQETRRLQDEFFSRHRHDSRK